METIIDDSYVVSCSKGHSCLIKVLNELTASIKPLFCAYCGEELTEPPHIHNKSTAIKFLDSL